MAEFRQASIPKLPPFVTMFSLSGIARAALLHGNDHRKPGITLRDLVDMAEHYLNVEDPGLRESPSSGQLRGVLNRIAYEQFPFQYSMMENIGRTLPLLADSMRSCSSAPTPRDWRKQIGADLEHLVRLGFVLSVVTTQNGGEVARTTLRMKHVAPVLTPLTPDDALLLIDHLFAATVEEHKARALEAQVPRYEKWSFNPLLARPLVKMGDALVAPVPRLILERISPTGLYFDGLEAWGSSFTDALGCAFEAYIGRQLRGLAHAQIHDQVTFGRPQRRTVDYLMVTDEVVLLVEVKASRPIIATRLGEEAGDRDFLRKVGRAVQQVTETAALIQGNHIALRHIPANRPLRGLVVTLEPFHLANTFLFDDLISGAQIPISVASSHEVEGLVAALGDRQDVGRRLLRALSPDPPTPPSLSKAVEGLDILPNPILDEAWSRFTAIFDELRAEHGA